MSRCAIPRIPRRRWSTKYGVIVVIVLVVLATAEHLNDRQYAALLACLGAVLPALLVAAA